MIQYHPMLATLAACALGVLFGMRHALDPDHLAAVATLMHSGRGPSIGLLWGAGHALALFVVGAVLAALNADLPPALGDLFELGVALMLVALGVRAVLRRAERPHDGHWHTTTRPLLVGMVHGLAGSGALTVLVLAGLPGIGARLVYTVLFGLGSVAGMTALSTVAGLALPRSDRARRGLAVACGVISAVMGVVWGAPVVERLAG
jgi:high-affinity nickel-transport protein